MGGFNQQSVGANGGVAWAKQIADSMDATALDTQIQSYQQAAGQLQQVQTTLQNVKNNLAASWTGDAAAQAQSTFQNSIDQAVQAHETIQAVVPPLQNAKNAQIEFVTTMQGIQNEKPVPSNSLSDEASHYVFGTPLPSQVAEEHNTAVRTETANALNKLSDSYEQSASEMNVAASGGPVDPGSGTAYAPEVAAGSSGDGLASSYGETIGGGETTKAGYVPTPGSGDPGVGGIADPVHAPTPSPNPDPIGMPVGGLDPSPDPFPVEPEPEPAPVGGGAGLITDEPVEANGAGESMLGGGLAEDGGGFGSGSGVFGENGFSDGQLTGGTGTGALVNPMSGVDDEGLGEPGAGSGGGFGAGAGEGGNPESMTGLGGSGGGMGGGGAEEDLASSKYSRGRYFDGDPDEDERPSLSPVRSAFEDATDGEGNKVNMMGGRRGGAAEDEEEERGKRPAYLKEDEFWATAQHVVPPVIR